MKSGMSHPHFRGHLGLQDGQKGKSRMERVTEAPGVAWLLRKGALELGGGLLNKNWGLVWGKQARLGGRDFAGEAVAQGHGYGEMLATALSHFCCSTELRARQGPAIQSLPGLLGAQITLILTLHHGRCLGEQRSPDCPNELCCPVDFGGCVPKKENKLCWGVSWL